MLYLGRPESIVYLNDTLIIKDSYDMNMITLYSISSKSINRIGRKGMGPGEFFTNYDLFVKNEEKVINIIEYGMGRSRWYNWNDFIKPIHSNQ